jgi:hypothetical protein
MTATATQSCNRPKVGRRGPARPPASGLRSTTWHQNHDTEGQPCRRRGTTAVKTDSLRLPRRPATGPCVELSRWRTELPFRRAADSAEDPTPARPLGGSARSYQELFAPLAIRTTASRQAARPYVYASPALGVTARICRIGRALVGQGLTATAAPYARSVDGHLAQHDLRTSHAAPATGGREGAE